MSEWIEWNGGKCPVPDDANVSVKFRKEVDSFISDDGYYSTAVRADGLDWEHGTLFTDPDGEYDIVAYRVVE